MQIKTPQPFQESKVHFVACLDKSENLICIILPLCNFFIYLNCLEGELISKGFSFTSLQRHESGSINRTINGNIFGYVMALPRF